MEDRHDLRVVREDDHATVISHAKEPRIGLTWMDKLAATSLVDGDRSELTEFIALVRDCAESLAGDGPAGARQRLLAREIAITKATLDATTAVIGHRMRANDAGGALLADKLANSAAKRLAILVEAHRAETLTEKRAAVVAIGHAEHVTIDTER